jgi:histidine triad (HIT) family protein
MAANTCLFCRIASGDVPATVVYEDQFTLTFLDHRPLFPGHCLVVPKEHYETLSELPRSLVAPVFETVQLLAQAVELALEAEGTFVAMNNRVSQSVPHLHVHVVPRKKKDGLKGFFWPRTKYANEESMAEIKQRIVSAIAQLQKS